MVYVKQAVYSSRTKSAKMKHFETSMILLASLQYLTNPIGGWMEQNALDAHSPIGLSDPLNAEVAVVNDRSPVPVFAAGSVDTEPQVGAVLGRERDRLVRDEWISVYIYRHLTLVACVDQEPKLVPTSKHAGRRIETLHTNIVRLIIVPAGAGAALHKVCQQMGSPKLAEEEHQRRFLAGVYLEEGFILPVEALNKPNLKAHLIH